MSKILIDKATVKLALEALITASGHVNNEAFVKVMMARDALVEALAEQPAQQEPVALLRVFMDSVDIGQSLAPSLEFKFASASAYPAAKMLPLGDHDLYNTPQPAQRKPLTEEEIDELSRTMVKGNKSVNWLCRAIEAAHGMKEST